MAKQLGTRLLLSRRDLGMNQDELSQRSGVSRTYISDLERGKITNAGVEVVFALASALGVGVGYLLGLTDDPLGDREAMDSDVPVDVQELLDVYESLSSDRRDLLLKLAKAIGEDDSSGPRGQHE